MNFYSQKEIVCELHKRNLVRSAPALLSVLLGIISKHESSRHLELGVPALEQGGQGLKPGVPGLETFMPCGEGILYVRPVRTNSLSFPGKQEDFSQTICVRL